MAWTTPKTWVTGELVTATDLNTHLKDNLNALRGVPSIVSNFALYSQTNSTGFIDVSSSLNQTVSVSAGSRLHVCMWGSCSMVSGTNVLKKGYFDILLDSNRVGDTTAGLQMINGSTWSGEYILPFNISYITSTLASGNHTIKPQYRSEDNAFYIKILQFQVWVRELPISN